MERREEYITVVITFAVAVPRCMAEAEGVCILLVVSKSSLGMWTYPPPPPPPRALAESEISLGVDSGRGVLFASWPLENRGQCTADARDSLPVGWFPLPQHTIPGDTLSGLAQVYITSHLSDSRASHVDSADEPGMCKQGVEVSS